MDNVNTQTCQIWANPARSHVSKHVSAHPQARAPSPSAIAHTTRHPTVYCSLGSFLWPTNVSNPSMPCTHDAHKIPAVWQISSPYFLRRRWPAPSNTTERSHRSHCRTRSLSQRTLHCSYHKILCRKILHNRSLVCFRDPLPRSAEITVIAKEQR